MTKLDPSNPAEKTRIKKSITDALAKELIGSDRSDIARRVEEKYEALLSTAAIFTHVPSLTAGAVRRDMTANMPVEAA